MQHPEATSWRDPNVDQGVRRAAALLVQQHRRDLVRTARYALNPALGESAEDVVSDVILEVLSGRLPKLNRCGTPADRIRFLKSVVKYRCLHVNRDARRYDDSLHPPGCDPGGSRVARTSTTGLRL
jgi:DNA-directed RNA polymerase specialized sigma24 family protein